MLKKDNIIDIIIVFISTAVIPNLLIYILQVNINNALLSAIVCSIILIILMLTQRIKALKTAQSKIKRNYNVVRIYAINGRRWAEEFGKRTIHVNKCILFIRGHVDGLGDKQRHESEKKEAIACWKRMLGDKIGQLIIYEYGHLSDHYYALLDDELLIVGLNTFSSLDSTGQNGDRNPQYIFRNDENKELIKKYVQHFDNYCEHYSQDKIYDSMIA